MAKNVRAWRDLGATSIIVEARGGGLGVPDQHLKAMQRFKHVTEENLSLCEEFVNTA
jgi:hypothetical protein